MDNGEYAPFHDRFFRPRAMVSANACYSLSTAETTVSGADILHLRKRQILYCRNSSRNSRLRILPSGLLGSSSRILGRGDIDTLRACYLQGATPLTQAHAPSPLGIMIG